MNFRILIFHVLVLGSFVYADVGSAAGKDSGPTNAPIREEMSGLYVVTSELLPLVLDKARFEDAKNAKGISTQMNRLKVLSEKMSIKTKRFADNDPSIRFVSERFSEDIQYAISMWNTGDREIPRRLLRNVTDYCISCHTRTSKGAHFHDVVQSRGFKSLPAVTKAEYLAATRQYDAAVKQYEHILVDRPLAKIDPEAWGQAMRKMLAITVRVKNNANLTLEMISKIQDSPESIVPSLRLEIADWRQAAKSWSEEKPLRINTDEARYLESKRLFDEAEVISAKTSGGGLIQYLRATALLHEMLGRLRGGENYQNMLWLAGRSAKSLKEFNLWAMQDIYFESCVRSGTDKVLSGKCYTALEESALESYGVVSRSGLPAFMRARLDALKPK